MRVVPGLGVLVVGQVITVVVTDMSRRPVRSRCTLSGSGATVAAALAGHGLSVTLAARVGADAPGTDANAILHSRSVTPVLAHDRTQPTGRYLLLTHGSRPLQVRLELGAAGGFRVGDAPPRLLLRARHLHVCGELLAHGGSRQAVRRLLDRARTGGLSVSVSTPTPAALASVGPARFLELAGPLDLLLGTSVEVGILAGAQSRAGGQPHPPQFVPIEGDPAIPGVAEVVVTDGGDGAAWQDRHSRVHVAGQALSEPLASAFALPPVAALPATALHGAGDAFTGGFLVPWLAGARPALALASGARAAQRWMLTQDAF